VSRRRARAACLSSALLTAVLTASPALAAPANSELGPREGADLSGGLSTGTTILLFVVVPVAVLLGVAVLTLLPGMAKADRYRPARGWSAAPVWFAGPPDPVAAVETAVAGPEARGGASGSW